MRNKQDSTGLQAYALWGLSEGIPNAAIDRVGAEISFVTVSSYRILDQLHYSLMRKENKA